MKNDSAEYTSPTRFACEEQEKKSSSERKRAGEEMQDDFKKIFVVKLKVTLWEM